MMCEVHDLFDTRGIRKTDYFPGVWRKSILQFNFVVPYQWEFCMLDQKTKIERSAAEVIKTQMKK